MEIYQKSLECRTPRAPVFLEMTQQLDQSNFNYDGGAVETEENFDQIDTERQLDETKEGKGESLAT